MTKKHIGLVALVCVVVLGIVGTVLIKRCGKGSREEIPMEETMASIEEILTIRFVRLWWRSLSM
ncbi:MAG: hypothetical protein J6T11_04750 [Bacteroidaceae bacterium]|nr:hypothetical protein [Bacteroidaceae bacterium]